MKNRRKKGSKKSLEMLLKGKYKGTTHQVGYLRRIGVDIHE